MRLCILNAKQSGARKDFHTIRHCNGIFYVTHSNLPCVAEITGKNSGGGGAVVVWRSLEASLASLREIFCFGELSH